MSEKNISRSWEKNEGYLLKYTYWTQSEECWRLRRVLVDWKDDDDDTQVYSCLRVDFIDCYWVRRWLWWWLDKQSTAQDDRDKFCGAFFADDLGMWQERSTT